tara:strand:- start:229 stop:2346 length:2118 start_codon:yes stop_codon:yes gene_type:complete
MKESMSALDLRAIASEFQSLLQSRVKKCYQPHYEQIVLRLNPKGSQSIDMVIVRGSRVYLSQRDRPMPVNPGQFAMLLRKYLANARLVAIEQLEFDRVLHLTFETGHGFYHLYIEMFRDGNVLLCDQSHEIIQPLTHATYAERTLKKGHTYKPPPQSPNPFEMDINTMRDILQSSEKSIISTLGQREVLGGSLANFVVELLDEDENMDASEMNPQKIIDVLSKIYLELTSNAKGFLYSKKPKPLGNIQTVDMEDFLAKNVVEAWPIKKEINNLHRIDFDSFHSAVDAWKGVHDARALARKEIELLDQSAPGRGFSTEVEKLERRLIQQEKALAGFHSKVEIQQNIGHKITEHYTHVDDVLKQMNEAIAKKGFEAIKEDIKEVTWVESLDSVNSKVEIFLPDETQQPGKKVWLYLDLSVHQNAKEYFEIGRKQKDKITGAKQAIEATKIALKRARKKELTSKESGKLNLRKRTKKFWFENHRWAIIGGHLLVGGKDAKGNDNVVKKHLKKEDRYLHADLHGAPSCVLKNQTGFELESRTTHTATQIIPSFKIVDKVSSDIDDSLTLRAASLALAWSRSWNAGGAHGTVYWVKPGQVSKTAETGEFIGKGAFIIRGERTWFRNLNLEIGLGLISINGVPLLASSTAEEIREITQRYVIIRPGTIKKDQFANKLYKATGLSTDEILSVLPGNVELVEDGNMFQFEAEK